MSSCTEPAPTCSSSCRTRRASAPTRCVLSCVAPVTVTSLVSHLVGVVAQLVSAVCHRFDHLCAHHSYCTELAPTCSSSCRTRRASAPTRCVLSCVAPVTVTSLVSHLVGVVAQLVSAVCHRFDHLCAHPQMAKLSDMRRFCD